jgi:hypothetical protein
VASSGASVAGSGAPVRAASEDGTGGREGHEVAGLAALEKGQSMDGEEEEAVAREHPRHGDGQTEWARAPLHSTFFF